MPKTRTLSRTLLALFGVISALVAFAGSASAAPYTNQPTISVSNQSPAAGSRLTLCGTGFHARARVAITLDTHRRLASVRTDRSGSFCTTIRLPGELRGPHSIVARDNWRNSASVLIQIVGTHHGKHHDGGHRRDSGTPIRVDPVSHNTGINPLATDGAVVIGISALMGLLLSGGAAMVFSGKRRKEHS